jgi:hypothetical protein
VELGQTACLTVGGKMFTARCALSLNVLTWRKVTDGCATAHRAPPITPVVPSEEDQAHL